MRSRVQGGKCSSLRQSTALIEGIRYAYSTGQDIYSRIYLYVALIVTVVTLRVA